MKDNTKQLSERIQFLESQIDDLEISLTTTVEHGDIVEDELAKYNDLLQLEIKNRVDAEDRLKKLVTLISQQKSDLEILIDTVVEHGDNLDFNWLEKIQLVEQESLTDALTGIANRRAFDNYFKSEWKRAIRNNSSLAFIMFDVDYFKLFNDLHGHSEGDQCLKNLTEIASSCLARPADLLARYGGEEFAIILPDTSLDGAKTLADSILLAIQNAKIIHGDSIASEYLSVSIGVNSCKPNLTSDLSQFIQSTDQLLYEAKDRGRNQVVALMPDTTFKNSRVLKYGSFITLHEHQKLEYLSISFVPSALSIQQRWRNNSLSADYLADYISTFLVSLENVNNPQEKANCANAISFIANELLENIMKYTVDDCILPSGINLYLENDSLILESFNYVDEATRKDYIEFINLIQNSNSVDLFNQRFEENALNNNSSGLGILTMINDYQATAAFKFLSTNNTYKRVITQITITI